MIDAASVHELRVISDFLRSLRAKFAYAEEERAQRERDFAMRRVAALRQMASKVECVANQTGDDVAATTMSIVANSVEMLEAAAAVRSQRTPRHMPPLICWSVLRRYRQQPRNWRPRPGDCQPGQRGKRFHAGSGGRKQRGGADDLQTADRGGAHRTDHLADR